MADPSTDDSSSEWLWHPGHAKLYRPVHTDDDRVVLLSAWHPDEVADARESGALIPADEAGIGPPEGVTELVDSLRFLDDETVAAVRGALDE